MAKIGRNEPCPCGSGKKYKRCCLNKQPAPSEVVKDGSQGRSAPDGGVLNLDEDDLRSSVIGSRYGLDSRRELVDRVVGALDTLKRSGPDAADAAFEASVVEHPSAGSLYRAWADMHLDERVPASDAAGLDRATAILERGLRACGDTDEELRAAHTELIAQRLRSRSGPPAYLLDRDVSALITCGERVPLSLRERIVARGVEVVPLLNALMLDAELYVAEPDEPSAEADRSYWGPAHAACLSATIGDLSSVDPILHVGAVDVGNDFLHLLFAWVPSAFGPQAIERFVGFTLDRSVYWYHRVMVTRGLVWLAGEHPELRPRVSAALLEGIASGEHDAELTTWLCDAALRTDDPALHDAVDAASARGAIDPSVAGPLDSTKVRRPSWYVGDPPNHHTPDEYFADLRRSLR